MANEHPVDAYPLTWPMGRQRTPNDQRKRADFGKRDSSPSGYRTLRSLTVAQALERLDQEIRGFTRSDQRWRIDPGTVIVSTNIRTRRDGLPYSGAKEPDDPGVAVYFELDSAHYCLASDRWTRVADNLAAIAAHLGALRGIERWGVGDLRQAFAGYVALPPPADGHWSDVLGVSRDATRAEVDQAWRSVRGRLHPDRQGGDAEAFAVAAEAYRAACQAVKS